MSRRLFAVALLPHGTSATRVDGLRAAIGDPRLADLPTHLTLVPPIDLHEDATIGLRRAVRRAASSVEPFDLVLGPASSFSPRTSTLHLSVGGDLGPLSELRQALRAEPLDRPDEHDFVPHVTLLQRASSAQVDAGLALLAMEVGLWHVGSVHVLERLRPSSGAVWHPVMEEPLGGPRVVGRGGVELHLRAVALVEPGVAALASTPWAPPLPAGGSTLVVVAERPGRPGSAVGAAWGRADGCGAVLDGVAVAGEERRQGIARRVVEEWCHAAARRGAGGVELRPQAGPATPPVVDAEAMAAALGFTPLDAVSWWRRVGPVSGLGSTP